MGFAAVYASSVLVQLVLCFWDHLFVVIWIRNLLRQFDGFRRIVDVAPWREALLN